MNIRLLLAFSFIIVSSSAFAAQPSIDWSTYLGGTAEDRAFALAVDDFGNNYVVGSTNSPDFPVSSGAFQTAPAGLDDAFIVKLNPSGDTILWATRIGGSANEIARSVAIGSDGSVYVCGETSSSDFPTTAASWSQNSAGGLNEGFVLRMKPDGSALLFSTYLGGVSTDYPLDLAIESDGDVVVVGMTGSSNFPTTSGVIDPAWVPVFPDGSEGFVTSLKADGSSLNYSTFLGGSGGSDQAITVALDAADQAIVGGSTLSLGFPVTSSAYSTTRSVGWDSFVTKLSSNGRNLIYSTYVGGNGNDFLSQLSVDSSGRAHVVGRTNSTSWPVSTGAMQSSFGGGSYDGYAFCLNADGSTLEYSTYIGGSGEDAARSVVLDSSNRPCIVGQTASSNFPVTADAIQPSYLGAKDAFFVRLNTAGESLSFGTFLATNLEDNGQTVAMNPAGHVQIAGWSNGDLYPVSEPGLSETIASSGIPDCIVTSIILDDAITTGVATNGSGIFMEALYPNPSSSSSSIRFRMNNDASASLKVYDARGRLVRNLHDGFVSEGWNSMSWDGKDSHGQAVVSGSYFVRVSSSNFDSEVRRLIIQR